MRVATSNAHKADLQILTERSANRRMTFASATPQATFRMARHALGIALTDPHISCRRSTAFVRTSRDGQPGPSRRVMFILRNRSGKVPLRLAL